MVKYKALILLLFILGLNLAYGGMSLMTPHAQYPIIPKTVNLMFLFIIVLVSCVIRVFLIKFDVSIPYGVFMVLAGVLWGILCNYDAVILAASSAIYMNPYDILFIYFPILIFNITFCLDVPIFLKTLPQTVVIGIFVSLVTGVFFGIMMRMVIGSDWTLRTGAIFGVFIIPVNAASIVYLLKQQSTRTRHISVLLEGEAIFSLIITEISHEMIVSFLNGYIIWWYQFFAVILIRFIFMGAIFGYLVGLLGRYLIHRMYTHTFTMFLFSFTIPFFTYTVDAMYISGCGSISVMIVGAMMGMERTVLPKRTNKFLTDIWETIGFIMDSVMCVIVTVLSTVEIAKDMSWTQYMIIFVSYLMYYACRFIFFLLFSPIISRLGYGMDLKGMIVCVWSGLKSPFSLALVRIFVDLSIHKQRTKTIYFQIVGIYFFSLLINGTLTKKILQFMGLRQISLARQVNMNNCMKHIFMKREQTVAILKMDRFLADANWPVVIEATNMKHPYRLSINDTDEDDFFIGYRFTACPECKKDIPSIPTEKELKDMSREARMRVLKSKKMCYSRQYENGMMSKEGIRILTQAVELAMDSEAAVIELEGLEKRFREENCLHRFIKKQINYLHTNQGDAIKPPRKYWRRLCFRICINDTFDRFMLVTIAIHCLIMTVDLVYHPPFILEQAGDSKFSIIVSVLGMFFACIYLLEFHMKILAYSWIWIWDHGVRTYFKSVYRVVDFIVMITCTNEAVCDMIYLIFGSDLKSPLMNDILKFIMLLRYVRLFQIFSFFYPKLVRYLDSNVDTQMAFTYELGKSYAIGEAEILSMLPYIIDNKSIREEIKEKIEHDRVVITKLLGMVQKEKPWVAITVKTKQAIRTILNGMKEAINQLRTAGWVDNYEQEKLNQVMGELYKQVNSIKTVQPSAPKVIFKEVAWMAGDQAVIDFLFENVTVKKFEPGDVVFGEGNVADGIYIIVTGLFMITYSPKPSVLESLHEFGQLPIADYFSATQYEEGVIDYIVSGNCVGEHSTLTGRAYNSIITADAHSQVYVLSNGVIKRAMELSPDPVIGLECRIWKEVSIRIAVPLLLSVPAYQTFSQDQIKYALERAFVPNLSFYKVFAVTDMIEDIILIEGIAADYNTRDTFVAPCCIPRTVQKLILPNSSLLNVPIYIETKLLIIPEKDVDEYDVMMLAEETCEMVATGSSSKCLQHFVQQKAKHKKKIKMVGLTSAQRRGPDGALSRSFSRYQATSAESAGVMYFKRDESETDSMYFDEHKRQEDKAAEEELSDDEKERSTFDYQKIDDKSLN